MGVGVSYERGTPVAGVRQVSPGVGWLRGGVVATLPPPLCRGGGGGRGDSGPLDAQLVTPKVAGGMSQVGLRVSSAVLSRAGGADVRGAVRVSLT